MSDLLTVEATAARLDVSAGTVRNLIRVGTLPTVRFSQRHVRVPAVAVEALLTARIAAARVESAKRVAQKRVS
jgi:excisionase family DNA binding protein